VKISLSVSCSLAELFALLPNVFGFDSQGGIISYFRYTCQQNKFSLGLKIENLITRLKLKTSTLLDNQLIQKIMFVLEDAFISIYQGMSFFVYIFIKELESQDHLLWSQA
jgi:phosphomannomutase